MLNLAIHYTILFELIHFEWDNRIRLSIVRALTNGRVLSQEFFLVIYVARGVNR
jgi:hypothetical protein